MKLLLIRLSRFTKTTFWREASTLNDSATRMVLPGVLFFGLVSFLIGVIEYLTPPDYTITVDVTVYEVGGALLGLLLVLRTNEGLSRWWEARKLWGGIVNQCRNFATAAIVYGPTDPAWRSAAIRWTIVFAHVCRRSLRGEMDAPEIEALIGKEEAARLASANHRPSHVALIMGRIMRVALDRLSMDQLTFLQIERERMSLIDHIGGCERILKTPIPSAYSVAIRRFIFFFLLLLPLGLIPKLDRTRNNEEPGPAASQPAGDHAFTNIKLKNIDDMKPISNRWMWLTPLVTMLVAFPLLSLDRIGAELQDPFSSLTLNHLELDDITSTVEANLLALLEDPAAVSEFTDFLLVVDLEDETPIGPT